MYHMKIILILSWISLHLKFYSLTRLRLKPSSSQLIRCSEVIASVKSINLTLTQRYKEVNIRGLLYRNTPHFEEFRKVPVNIK